MEKTPKPATLDDFMKESPVKKIFGNVAQSDEFIKKLDHI